MNYQFNPYFYQQNNNNGFVTARSIEEARNYPVALGNAVMFKIENEPVVCEKSQGMSQFDAPRFEVFDLVRRTNVPTEVPKDDYKSELEQIKAEVARLRSLVEGGEADG